MEEVAEPTDEESNYPMSGTTPWAVEQEKSKDKNDSPGYVLELDENFNPINPTTVASSTTELDEVSTLDCENIKLPCIWSLTFKVFLLSRGNQFLLFLRTKQLRLMQR
jgi:hypothetical protein